MIVWVLKPPETTANLPQLVIINAIFKPFFKVKLPKKSNKTWFGNADRGT